MSDAVKQITNVIQLYENNFNKLDISNFAQIAHVGAIVARIRSGIQLENEVIDKLRELEKQIAIYSRKMDKHFDQVKELMGKNSFYAEVAMNAPMLMKLMRDTLSQPIQDSVNIFEDASKRQPPLRDAYKLISLIEQKSTNPLRKAMAAESLPSRSTFNKWHDNIMRVIGEFYILELYINGLLWDADMYGPNQLKSRIETLQNDVENWRIDYENKVVWPEKTRAVIEKIQDVGTNFGKQDTLEKTFDDILTTDIFYIQVYNQCSDSNRHNFHSDPSQTIISCRRGGCCVVVYRSRHAKITRDGTSSSNIREKCKHILQIRANIDRLLQIFPDSTEILSLNIAFLDYEDIIEDYKGNISMGGIEKIPSDEFMKKYWKLMELIAFS
ncbi:unnamed protein product [Caenorhabditis angaria]|uniref:Uncharacterized protein n=1 Tax=Caenorhabditis angaria TaxID=860376 RepID=A0A9P1ISL6_9PELO|nr:unnamed protein product [Caenorhabditis angaria]